MDTAMVNPLDKPMAVPITMPRTPPKRTTSSGSTALRESPSRGQSVPGATCITMRSR
jgi:hypothetical protein